MHSMTLELELPYITPVLRGGIDPDHTIWHNDCEVAKLLTRPHGSSGRDLAELEMSIHGSIPS